MSQLPCRDGDGEKTALAQVVHDRHQPLDRHALVAVDDDGGGLVGLLLLLQRINQRVERDRLAIQLQLLVGPQRDDRFFCGFSCCALPADGSCVFSPSAGMTFRLIKTKTPIKTSSRRSSGSARCALYSFRFVPVTHDTPSQKRSSQYRRGLFTFCYACVILFSQCGFLREFFQ